MVAAFWGCLLRGVTVIPVDVQCSTDLFRPIIAAAKPRGVLIGDELETGELPVGVRVWHLRDIEWANLKSMPTSRTGAGAESPSARMPVSPGTVAEIVFTSGATGEPKGIVITHRNIVANIAPIEHEARKFKRYVWPLRLLRFLSLLPLSHMFGQALAMFLPPLVNAAAVFMKGYNPDQIIAQIRRHRITLVRR